MSRRILPAASDNARSRHRDLRDHRHAADGDARRHHRHRRAAAAAGRSRPLRRGQELGHHRLRADLRRPAADRRSRRRRHRAQAGVPVRRRRVHDRLAGVRPGHRRHHADRRPRGAGHRRSRRGADRAGADRDDLRRRPCPQPRLRGIGRHAGLRFGAGPGARRRADGRLVAAGVPDQHPDRHPDHLDRRHPARRDTPRAAETRRRRGAAGDAGLHVGGAGVHPGSGRAAGSTRG